MDDLLPLLPPGVLPISGGQDLPTIDVPDLSTPALTLPAGWPGGGAPGVDVGSVTFDSGGAPGGGGGFPWDRVGTALDWTGKIGGLAKTGIESLLGIQYQSRQAAYQKQLEDYYRQKAVAEADYNLAVKDYLARRAQFEADVASQVGGAGEAFQGALGQFETQMASALDTTKGIVAEQAAAAKPLLAQAQQLIEPAVAALAKGEVPPLLQPIFDQTRQRAMAAGVQAMVNAGMDPETARASLQPQIDQQIHSMLLQAAQAMLTSGQTQEQLGLQELGQEAATTGQESAIATGMLAPVFQEFLAMQRMLENLFGGFPSPLAGTPPPAPVA